MVGLCELFGAPSKPFGRMRNRDLGNEVADFGREVHGRGDLPVACGVAPEGVFTEGFFEGAGRGLAGEPKVSPMARYALWAIGVIADRTLSVAQGRPASGLRGAVNYVVRR